MAAMSRARWFGGVVLLAGCAALAVLSGGSPRHPDPPVGPVSHPYELTQQDEGLLDHHHANAVKSCTSVPAKWRDRLSGCQWYLSDSRSGVFDVNVEPAWAATLGEGVTLLVVDYPVDYRHEDLRDNIDPAGSPGLTEAAVTGSPNSHGTAMASIIAARDNAVGFRGVAPRAALTWRSINSAEIHSYLAVDHANTWNTCVEVIDADGSVAGTWVPSCGSWVRKPAPAKFYTFSLDAPSRVTIDLRSSVDSYLYLRKYSGLSGGWTARDDDSGEGRNARFSRTLPAGVYTIEATTYERERRSGSFTLQIAGLDGASAPEAIESERRWAPVWDSLLEAAVVNRSYGPSNRTRPYKDAPDDDGFGHLSAYEVYDAMAEFGFGGRGTLNVVAGGKTLDWTGLVQWSTLAEERSHPAVVVACATDRWGRRQARWNTSLEGPSLWVCAPAGGIVTAALGDRYYLSKGTPSSPATALVSGVAALVRSIDSSLSWRDVKLILAASAQHNDPDDAGWQHGAAVYGAPGQNYRYHHSYGFGIVDAGAAVQLAQSWRYLPAYRDEHVSAPTLSPALAVPDDGGIVTAGLTADPEIDFVEYVEAHLVLDAPWFRDLEVELESPSGAVSTLSVPVGDIRDPDLAKYDCKQASECGISGSFRFGTAAHLGEDPAGTWTLRLTDRRPNGNTNTLESWSLRFFGHKASDPSPSLTPSPTFGPWPQVSIAADADIDEGDDAVFTVIADPAPAATLDVTVTVAQTGDYGVTTGERAVTIGTSGTATLSMATTNDSADEADGSVTATLRAVGGYTVSAAAGSAAVAVADDDDEPQVADPDGAPCDTATAISRARAAFAWHTDNNGGNEVWFWQILAYLGADPMPAPPGGTVPASVTPEAVRTFSDGKTWPGWVPINAAMGCHVPPPEISITAGADVDEGSDAAFTVSAVPAPSAALDVTVAVTAAGDFGVSPGSHTVTVPTTGAATLTVATTDDSVDEADGSVTATVGAGTGYTVSATAGAASVAVADDDAPSTVCVPSLPSDAVTVSEVTGWRDEFSHAAHQQRWDRVLAALGVDTGEAAMTVADAQAVKARIDNARWNRTVRTLQAMAQCDTDPPPTAVPEVSIAASGGIAEGGDAAFTVTAVPAPSAPLAVSVTVAQTGDFGAATGTRQVAVPTSGTVTLTVATVNDSADEADGSVAVTVGAASGYTVSATAGTATVAVADDDDPAPPPPPPVIPEVSITVGADVTEGGDAAFTVTAVPAPSAPLTVDVTVAQSGDFGAATGSQSVTIPISGSATLTIATTNDSTDEADGTVTVTVDVGTGYTVSQSAGSAAVAVADDDDPPPPVVNAVPSLSISDASAGEGGALTFTVTLSPVSGRYVWVHYYARPAFGAGLSATFADFAQAYGMLTFSPGETSKTITVAAVDDSSPEGDETFRVVLYSAVQAAVADGEGIGTITDND